MGGHGDGGMGGLGDSEGTQPAFLVASTTRIFSSAAVAEDLTGIRD